MLVGAMLLAAVAGPAVAAPASPPQVGALVPLVGQALELVGAIIEDRASQRDFDRAIIAALDPDDPADKALLRRYVAAIVTREEITTGNLVWWQTNVFDKIADLLDDDLVAAIRDALKAAG